MVSARPGRVGEDQELLLGHGEHQAASPPTLTTRPAPALVTALDAPDAANLEGLALPLLSTSRNIGSNLCSGLILTVPSAIAVNDAGQVLEVTPDDHHLVAGAEHLVGARRSCRPSTRPTLQG